MTSPDPAIVLQDAFAWCGHHAPLILLALVAVVLPSAGWAAAAAASDRTRARRLAHGLVAVAAAGFGGLALAVQHAPALTAADVALATAAHASVPPAALIGFDALSMLGEGLTLGLVCAFAAFGLVLAGQARPALALVMATAGNGLINGGLKRIFERARPSVEVGGAHFHGFAFPSGHASGALVTFGMLAWIGLRLLHGRRRFVAVEAAALLVVLVGASRIFLEAHFATDVLAGYCTGGVWLAVCIAWLERRWRAAPASWVGPVDASPVAAR